MEKYILTGGACTGKTSVCEFLRKNGHMTLDEAARLVIDEENLKSKRFPSYRPMLPQTCFARFEELIVSKQVELEAKADLCKGQGRIFLDRSLVDPIAYSENNNSRIDDMVYGLIEDAGYSRKIFLLDPVPYKNDSARWEDEAEARKVHDLIGRVYRQMGFDVVKVPVFDGKDLDEKLEKRVRFILEEVAKNERN